MSHSSEAHLDLAEVQIPASHPLRKLRTGGVVAGLIGLVTFALMGASDLERALHGYLVSFEFFLSIGLGALFFVLVQHAARAGWSIAVRRLSENLMATLPLFALLFLPVAAAVSKGMLYEWATPEAAHDKILHAKSAYLNVGFFLVRAVLYFVAWTLLARFLRGKSVAQDSSGDIGISHSLRKWSGLGLVIYAFTLTFAAFDWIMSLYPHWYSTIFGGYCFAGGVVAHFAVMIVLIELLRSQGLLGKAVTEEHHFNLGKLLFAFTVFWAYMAVSQFLLIWYANMPEETVFFKARFTGSWLGLSWMIMVGHFIVPFLYLLPRTIKRFRPTLLLGAFWMLLMHYLDLYWLIMPSSTPDGFSPSMVDLAAFLLIGGAFVTLLSHFMTSASLVPLKDPRLAESLRFWDP